MDDGSCRSVCWIGGACYLLILKMLVWGELLFGNKVFIHKGALIPRKCRLGADFDAMYVECFKIFGFSCMSDATGIPNRHIAMRSHTCQNLC